MAKNRSLAGIAGFGNNNKQQDNNGGAKLDAQNDTQNQQVQAEKHQESNEAQVQPEQVSNNHEISEETVEVETNNGSSTQVEGDKLDGAIDELKSMMEEKKKKKTQEDTHTRATFMVDNDLLKRLDKLAKNQRGFKTLFINKAIKTLLDELEK